MTITRTPGSKRTWSASAALLPLLFAASASAAFSSSGIAENMLDFGPNLISNYAAPLGQTLVSSDSHEWDQTVATDIGPMNCPFFPSASASSWADSSVGVSHVRVKATAMNSPMSYTFLDTAGYPFTLNNRFRAKANAFASSSWNDRITISSSTLPPETMVQVRITYAIHGTAFADNIQPFASSGLSVVLTFGSAYDYLKPAELPAGWSYSSEGFASDGSGSGTFVMTRNVEVGRSYNITGMLSASANAAAGFALVVNSRWTGDPNLFASEASAGVDAGNTAYYGIEVLTPGASYTSDSGYVYDIPVPEPSGLVVILAGLATALKRRRRNSGIVG